MSARSAPGGRLPNFIVIGAMKAGTTSLHHYLSGHPEVFMPKVKELDFFTAELGWNRGWRWYERQFAGAGPRFKAVGEASTSYTKYPRYEGVAERIAEHLPDSKLIYVVRDPIQRIRSHYQHNVAIGEERRPIEEAVRAASVYVDYSRYSMQLDRYFALFRVNQVLVLISENLRGNRLQTMQRVFNFIGVNENARIANLNEEFYRTQDRPAYGRTLGGARRALKRLFPRSVGLWRGRFLPASIKSRLGRPVRTSDDLASVAIPPETADAIREELADDVRRLRSYIDEDFDGWGIG